MNKWDKRFMDIAKTVSTWTSCCKYGVGAIIVKDRHIISTGYNGAPKGITTCAEKGYCNKCNYNIKSGDTQCFATHAEQNAICQAAKMGQSVEHCTMYCTKEPCSICTKILINSGIDRVVYLEEYGDEFARNIVKQSSISFEKYEDKDE